MNRRTFIATAAAAASVRGVPKITQSAKSKRVLMLVYDKTIGAMRAIDRIVR